MTVLLALAGAVAYGVSDFVGGLVSRRTTPWPTALLACLGALAGTLALAVALPGHPTRSDAVFGLLAGLGSGAGTAFLYRGLAAGRMGVVAPISAVGAAVVPVVVGVLGGERPDILVWTGIVLALPGIWMVSREPDPSGAAAADGVLDGLLAGLGFGMLFAASGQIGRHAGYWPLVGTQVVSVLSVAVVAAVLRKSVRPTDRVQWWGVASGLLASVAVLGFLLATQRGLLAVAAVLTSLYPAATVLLASLVLRERIHRGQAGGLALCAASVVCVALG